MNVLICYDHDGQCAYGDVWSQVFDEAVFDRHADVRGWQHFDGPDRPWYRLPDAVWTFCYPTLRTFELAESEYLAESEEMLGRCLACGALAGNVEPDAHRYTCNECGQREVYGLEELIMMGRVEIVKS